MTDAQRMPDDPALGIMLTDRGAVWVAAARHSRTGAPILVTLVPAAGEDAGYWNVGVVDILGGTAETSRRPVSPYGVGLFLPHMGVDPAACEWVRKPLNA